MIRADKLYARKKGSKEPFTDNCRVTFSTTTDTSVTSPRKRPTSPPLTAPLNTLTTSSSEPSTELTSVPTDSTHQMSDCQIINELPNSSNIKSKIEGTTPKSIIPPALPSHTEQLLPEPQPQDSSNITIPHKNPSLTLYVPPKVTPKVPPKVTPKLPLQKYKFDCIYPDHQLNKFHFTPSKHHKIFCIPGRLEVECSLCNKPLRDFCYIPAKNDDEDLSNIQIQCLSCYDQQPPPIYTCRIRCSRCKKNLSQHKKIYITISTSAYDDNIFGCIKCIQDNEPYYQLLTKLPNEEQSDLPPED